MGISTREGALGILSGLALAVGFGVGILATLDASSAAPGCASFATCLTDPVGLLAAVHTFGAGLLVVLSVGVVILSVGIRRSDRRMSLLAVAALGVLGLMATSGALLATGELPPAASQLQFVWLAAYIALNVAILLRSRSLRGLSTRPMLSTANSRTQFSKGIEESSADH